MNFDFYKLSADPFRMDPDHRFFYASQTHKTALAYLQYGLQQGEGFFGFDRRGLGPGSRH